MSDSTQRRGGLARSLLEQSHGERGAGEGERAGTTSAALTTTAAVVHAEPYSSTPATTSSSSATSAAVGIFRSGANAASASSTFSSNENTPKLLHPIIGSPFPFVLRQEQQHPQQQPRRRSSTEAAPPPPAAPPPSSVVVTGFNSSSATMARASTSQQQTRTRAAAAASSSELDEPLLSSNAADDADDVDVDVEAGRSRSSDRGERMEAAAAEATAGARAPPSSSTRAAAGGTTATSESQTRDAANNNNNNNSSTRFSSLFSSVDDSFVTSLVYGAINALVGLPTLVSFSIIVYGTRPVYRPYLPDVAKLAFLASAVHQAVFCALSSLPFAVAQAQDTPLIILASIAAGVADECRKRGADGAATAATALATLAAATFVVGVALVAFGYLRAASFVQYLPLPCVGGYLAFVGFFVSIAGLNLSVNSDLATVAGWKAVLLEDHNKLAQLFACLGCTAMFLLVLRKCSHPAALPAAIVAVPAAFYAALAATGATLEDASRRGWTLPAAPSKPWWSVYQLFDPEGDGFLRGLVLEAGIKQIPKFVVLFAVVAFGSCLDVAAISSSSSSSSAVLDFDRELKTVGFANVAAGAVGAGFTGSYIFSQTIFSMANGVRSRVHGVVIVAAEFAAFFSSVSAVPLFPLCLFGSLLTLFGVEILLDWLVHSREKVGGGAEYWLLWGTFLSIVVLGLEKGVAAGLLLCVAQFSFAYARVNATASHVAPSRAGAARPPAQRDLLAHFSRHRAAIALSGVIFFGSAFAISKNALEVAAALAADADDAAADAEEGSVRAGERALEALRRNRSRSRRSPSLAPNGDDENESDDGGEDDLYHHPPVSRELAAALAAAPRFLLLDFRGVRGIDATAASAFASLARRLASQDESVGRRVTLIVCHLTSKKARRLLAAHGFELIERESESSTNGDYDVNNNNGAASFPSPSRPGLLPAYASMDDAVFATEEAFLAAARATGAIVDAAGCNDDGDDAAVVGGGIGSGGGNQNRTGSLSPSSSLGGFGSLAGLSSRSQPSRPSNEELLAVALRAVCAAPDGLLPRGDADAAAAAPFLTVLSLSPGQPLFSRGEPADAIFIVLRGNIELKVDYLATAEGSGVCDEKERDDETGTATAARKKENKIKWKKKMLALPAELRAAPSTPRSFYFGPGAVVGTMDFFGGDGPGAPRRGSAYALPPRGAVVGSLSRSRFQEMAVSAPAAAAALLGALLRAEVLGNIHSLEVLEAAAAVARA